MKELFKKLFARFKNIRVYESVIQSRTKSNNIASSLTLFIAYAVIIAFLVMSIANIMQKSYYMLVLTSVSALCLVLAVVMGIVFNKEKIVSHSMVLVCAIVFSIFGIIGGNEGFAILWIVLFPFVSLLICDLNLAFIVNTYFFVYCVVCLWTPIVNILPFSYAGTFALRFPLLYAVSYTMSFILAVKLKEYQYNMIIKQEELEYKKDFDEMTGVYNRSKYEEMIKNQFNNCKSIGVMYFDVNFLKFTNDSFGHEAGDVIIKNASKSLKQSLPKQNAYLFRIGGDEFVVVLENCSNNACEDFIAKWSKKLDAVNKKGKYITSVASGYAFAEGNYDFKEIIKKVDMQMYVNKDKMKDKFIKENPLYLNAPKNRI